MKKDDKIYTESNRKAWNEAMTYHKKAMDKKWDSMFSDRNYIYQKNPELAELRKIGIEEKSVAHLSCNNGIELMSLKRLGAAKCTGFDISDTAIEEAKKRADKFQIECEFVRTDVLDIDKKLFHQYDLIYITVGALVWIPNLKKYFSIAHDLLRKDGTLFIYEHHPFANVLPWEDDYKGEIRVTNHYFTDDIYKGTEGIDYYGGEQYDSSPSYEFSYTISDLINAVAQNGFCIISFEEYEKDITLSFDYVEKSQIRFPLSYILRAKKLLN